MRHRVKGRKLNRTASHRVATLRALSKALLQHKKIKTTLAKAKETRRFVEPLITKAKDGTIHARRYVARHINDNEIIKELFGEIVEKIGDRAGGYTRVVKLGQRQGDAAEMAILELVDYNDVVEKKRPKKKAKAEKVETVEAEVVKTEDAPKDEVSKIAEAEEVVTEEVEETKDTSEKEEVEKTDEVIEDKKSEEKTEIKEEVKTETKEEVKAETKEEVKTETKTEAKKNSKKEDK